MSAQSDYNVAKTAALNTLTNVLRDTLVDADIGPTRVDAIIKRFSDALKLEAPILLEPVNTENEPRTAYEDWKYGTPANSVPCCSACGGILDLLQGDLNYCPNCGAKIIDKPETVEAACKQ